MDRASGHIPFSEEEVCTALHRMPRGKSTGVALYSADLFREAEDATLYATVARLFDFFAMV